MPARPRIRRKWSEADLLGLRPMLAKIRKTPFDSDVHLFEMKWDGVRYLAYRLDDELRLINRKGAEGTRRYPELHRPLLKLPSGTVIDGEVIALEDGMPSLPKLMRRDQVASDERIRILSQKAPVVYVVFDVLVIAGESVMELPLLERKDRLHALLKELVGPRISESPVVLHRGTALYKEAERLGLEGVMAKRIDSAYQPGRRTDDWLKIKPFKTREFEVIGFLTEGGKRRVSALVLGERQDGQMILRGKVGAGFTESDRYAAYDRLNGMPMPRHHPPGGPRAAHWRNTGLKAIVRYLELTNDGKLRAPAFKGFV